MKRIAPGLALWTMLLGMPTTSGADQQDFEIARPPIKTAGRDERGRITVNGQPFFPILMYDVPLDADSLKMFREHGFNVLSARAEDSETVRQHGFYAAAHGTNTEGLKLDGVLFGVGMDSPALNWKDDLRKKCQADLAQMRRAFPNRPIFHAIGYWEDEPAGVFSNQLPRKERYEELIQILDVSAPYLYPLPYQPVRSVGEAVARANSASDGRKPLLPVLQLFVWKPEDRYPTPAELKCMAYLSLIHGADGIGYYSYNYVTGKPQTNIAREQPELWRSVKQINAEVQQIGQFLLESRPEPSVTVIPSNSVVEWRAATNGDSIWLLLANTSPESQSVKLRWSSESARLDRIDDGPKLSIEKSMAECPLAPHQTLCLRGAKR